MSPRLTSFAAVLLLSSAASYAVRPPPAEPAPAATPAPAAEASKPEPVAPYELKTKSKFAASTDPSARAPFWPIGWVKRKPGVVQQSAAPAAPKVLIDEKAFRVTSILIGTGTTPSLAIINGRTYSEGEFLRVPKGSPVPPVRIRVQRINDGNVILQNADQILVASLHRPELSEKRSEELLLDPDR